MAASIVIFCRPKRLTAILEYFIAKDDSGKSCEEYPYHAAWLLNEMLYEMEPGRGFVKTPLVMYEGVTRYQFKSPVQIEPAYLEMMVGKRSYGYFDVALFPIFRMLGINWFGTHCSEAINDDLWFHKYRTPWIPYGQPPSPCSLLHWAMLNLEEE